MRLLAHAAVFLATAVILVPLFQRFRLGAVLGYLVAQYAVHQDEDQYLQTVRQAADQLRELFEADAAHAPVGRMAAGAARQPDA